MKNWAGNRTYQSSRLVQPRSLDELQGAVAEARRFRVLGSRHSFNDIADTDGDLISLAAMPRRLEIDTRRMTATVDGSSRYGDICERIHAAGCALHNLASLPHISVAGACATGTHGSGDRAAGLASAVRAMTLVRTDGEVVEIEREATDRWPLSAAAVSLGALGVVTSLTLDMEPTYDVRQDVFEDLPIRELELRFDAITAAADSVSCFWEWRGEAIDQVWLKQRVAPGALGEPPVVAGATPAVVDRHPIRGLSPAACTSQLGIAGRWHHRLPHFRMGHTPSSGKELQSEYFVHRADALPAFAALRRLRDRIRPVVHVMELRTIAADELWLSPAFGRPTVAFHFTWRPAPEPVDALLPDIEAALAQFDPRPHWGKVFRMRPADVAASYSRLPAFGTVARELDPAGKLRNSFLDRYIFGA
jgi:xylitol oxidase